MYVIVLLCFPIILLFVVLSIRKILFIRKCLQYFPGPPPIFLLGNALDFSVEEGVLKVLLRYTEKYGRLLKGQYALRHGLMTSNHEFIRKLLMQTVNLTKGPMYYATKSWLGEGLLTSSGKKWKVQRKILNTAFSPDILINFMTVFNEQSNILVEELKKITPIVSFDVHESLSLCSLDIICETIMGASVNAQKNRNNEYVKSIKEMCEIIIDRTMKPWKFPDILFVFSPEYCRQKKCLKTIQTFDKKVIEARKLLRSRMNDGQLEKIDEFGRKKKFALLDALLECSENGKILSENEIEHQVHTFMFAGHDTSTATMNFLIYELAKNPKIQDLAYEEQRIIFGDDFDRQVNYNDLQQMKYLDMVIKETLRLYPPVSIIARQVTEHFSFGNRVIPEGITIMMFLYALHRNPEVFPNPEIFDPSRFENPENIPQHAFIPFSTGPRNCIGRKFAMFEIKVIMSKLIRNFQFSAAKPEHILDLRAEVVLTSKNGVKINLSRRKEVGELKG